MSEPSRAQESASNLPTHIGAPAQRALALAGITRLQQLTSYSETELLRLHGLGSKAVRLLQQALQEQGLTLAH